MKEPGRADVYEENMADEKELRCTVCLEHFSEPKVLPCCHTFCRGCLERILEKSKEKKKLTCPQCRLQHTVPETGPGGFLTDFTIAHELEKHAITSKPATCEQCETSEKAVAYCCDCETHLCEFCSGAHERLKLWKDHKVLPLESLSPDCEQVRSGKPVSLYCSSHPTEPLKVYCKTCEALVCCECLVAKHQSHKLGTIDKDTRNEVHTKLQSLADKVQQKLPGFENSLEHIKKVEKTLVARPGDLKSAINTTFDTLSAALESRRKQLLCEAESKCNGDLKKVWVQKEQVETTITALKSTLSFAERALQCSSDVELLSLSSQAVSWLRELSKAKWDPTSIQQFESTRLKFMDGNDAAYFQRIGKIVVQAGKPNDSPEPDGIDIQSIPAIVPLGKEIVFRIAQRSTKEMKTTLKPENLQICIQYGGQAKKQMKLQASVSDDDTCTVPFTPICGGPHRLSVSSITMQPNSSSLLPLREQTINVAGVPVLGSRVRRGPDWTYSDQYSGSVGTVVSYVNDRYCDQVHKTTITVRWPNGNIATGYNWGRNNRYDLELVA